MGDGFDDVACACLALCTDHRSAFGDAAEGFAQVPAATDEGHSEVVLGDVIEVVGWGKDFGLVDVVDADGFEDLDFAGFSSFVRDRHSYYSLLRGGGTERT